MTIAFEAPGANEALLRVYLRDKLSSDRTYYLSPGGDDSNSGTSSGAAWKTLQYAYEFVASLDCNGHFAVVEMADGSYDGLAVYRDLLNPGQDFLNGNGSILFSGNNGNFDAVVVNDSQKGFPGAPVYVAQDVTAVVAFEFVDFVPVSAINCVAVGASAYLQLYQCGFGAATFQQVFTYGFGSRISLPHPKVHGNASAFAYARNAGQIVISDDLTVTGTPAFSDAFAHALLQGQIITDGVVYSGGATGTRYKVASNGVIDTGGGGASFLPGNGAGSAGTGGLYL